MARSMYIYHTGLYAMNCICTGDLSVSETPDRNRSDLILQV